MEILTSNPVIPDKTKEACAIETMRFMLQKYSEDNNIPFKDAFFTFSTSTTYHVLFDFETEVWKEGPDYLRSLFEDSLRKNNNL